MQREWRAERVLIGIDKDYCQQQRPKSRLDCCPLRAYRDSAHAGRTRRQRQRSQRRRRDSRLHCCTIWAKDSQYILPSQLCRKRRAYEFGRGLACGAQNWGLLRKELIEAFNAAESVNQHLEYCDAESSLRQIVGGPPGSRVNSLGAEILPHTLRMTLIPLNFVSVRTIKG